MKFINESHQSPVGGSAPNPTLELNPSRWSVQAFHREGRNSLAKSRISKAWKLLESCELCAHRCGVNRLAGSTAGRCHVGNDSRIFSAQIEVSDELEVIPTFAIAFGGCDMRCGFCITGKESWSAQSGSLIAPPDMADKARQAIECGARSIMILGGEPTIHLPAVMELSSILPENTQWIWKTNAHGTHHARDLLDRLFDLWIADFKFGNNACAERLARTSNYLEAVQDNLIWAANHSDLIVRHLLMPGHLECCWKPVAQWIASRIPGTRVNLRGGFWPAWQSKNFPEFRSSSTNKEWERALEIADNYSIPLTF